MPRQTTAIAGPSRNLLVIAHLAPSVARAELSRVTTASVVTEVWGAGTSAYRPVINAYGGWDAYLARVAALYHRADFEHVGVAGWSAGGALVQEVLVQQYAAGQDARLPDAVLLLDAVYGSKPPGSVPGDGKVVRNGGLAAVARYAVAAARGERVCVLVHSDISTPYASSGECVRAIVGEVEQVLGQSIPEDTTLTAADLEGRPFVQARALNGLHVVSFAGRDGAEHIAEARLIDRVMALWVPWAMEGGAEQGPPTTPSRPPSASLPVLRRGDRGPHVWLWQETLRDLNFPLGVDGVFGPVTEAATRDFQRDHGLVADGVVGAATRSAAADATPNTSEPASITALTPPPFGLLSDEDRDTYYGRITYTAAPTPDNPEAIALTGSWAKDNIVMVDLPMLRGLPGAPASGKVAFHRLAADRLRALWLAWQEEGLLPFVKSWGGSWAPRFVRGRPGVLSRHAHAIAFDINAPWNPLGRAAVPGAVGDVTRLVPLAREHGFFWGGDFSGRPDPMHFEVAVTPE